MALTSFFTEQIDGIREFAESPEGTMLVLRHETDVERLVKKVLISLDEDDSCSAVMAASAVPYDDHPQFFGDLLQELVEENERHREEFAANGVELPQVDEEDDRPAYEILEDYVSRVAEALPDFVGGYVVILRPEKILHEEGFRNAMAYLAEHTRCEWAKFLVLDRRPGILEGFEEQFDRVLVQDFHLSTDEIEERVAADVAAGNLNPMELRQYTAMLGSFAYSKKDYQEAQTIQQQVLAMAEQDGEPRDQATALYNLGNTYLGQKEYDLAEETFARSIEIATDDEAHSLAGMSLTNLGVVLQRQGRMDQSLECFDTARETFRALNHRPNEIHVLDNKAAVLALEGRSEEAEQTWQEALQLCDTMKAPQFARLREAAREDIEQKLRRHRESKESLSDEQAPPSQEEQA